MKKATLTSTLALAGVLLLTVAASDLFAMGYGRGGGQWGGRGGGPCIDGSGPGASGLGLTAEQTAKMKELRDAQQKEVTPLRDKMINKRSELKLLWLQANPDRDRINAVQKEMRTLRDKMQDEMTAYRLDMLKVLTPEQQARFQAAGARRGYGPGLGFGDGCEGGGMAGMRRGMGHPGGYGGPHMGRGGY